MARVDGLYIGTVTLGGVSDGGDVELEVVTPTGEPVSTIALTVSGGSATVDIPANQTAAWPNEIRLKINATEGDAFKSVTIRNSRGTVEFIRDLTLLTNPTLTGMGITLSGSAHTFTWSDDYATNGRKYQIRINGTTKPGTIVYPAAQIYVTGLPVDGSTVNVVLDWWDNDDLATKQSVAGTVTAHTLPVGTGSQFIIPASNIAEGNYGATQWGTAIGGIDPKTWEAGGNTITSISTVSGRRSLGVRLDGTVIPSTRLGATADIPASQKASVEQWVYFDSGFDWGGTNEGGKLGFGLGGGSRPLDGPAVTDGFSARFTWGTGGALSAQVLDGSGPSDGIYFPLGHTAARASWFKLKLQVEMNTAGVADGKLTVWVNGTIALSKTDIEWFATGTPQIDVLQHYTRHGGTGPTWTPGRVNRVYYSSIFWAVGLESIPVAAPVFTAPAAGQYAPAANTTFTWSGATGVVYDLHVYSNAARTQKVIGQDGVVMDTNGIGTATSHTFSADPLEGASRYARLYWWPDASYTGGGYIDLDYYSYSSTAGELTLVVDWTETVGHAFVSPSNGYQATSGQVTFSWVGPVGAYYILTIYSDAGRTTKMIGSDFVPLETDEINEATSHTFTNVPTDGATSYVRLFKYDGASYTNEQIVDLEFTNHSAGAAPSISPVSGTLAGASQQFTVANLPAGYKWGLKAGTAANPSLYFDSGALVATNADPITVTSLPTDGSLVKIRFTTLDTQSATTTQDYSFTAKNDNVNVNADMTSLKTLFDNYIGVSRSQFDSWGSRYSGTSGGGYHAMPATFALGLMYEATSQASYVQEAVDIAFNYINAGYDRTGNAVHSPQNYYPLNGYKDWVHDRSGYLDGHINHFHQEWRAGWMVAMALHALNQHGGSGITPSGAATTMYNFLAVHVWDKYSSGVAAANTPPVIDSRTLEGSVGTDQVSRLCGLALIMDEYAGGSKGNNRYHTYYNQKIPALVSEITARGGYPGQWTDPDNWPGTETMDVAHATDTFGAISLSERLGKTYVTQPFRDAVGNNIDNNLYPPTDTDSVWTPEADGIYEGVWSARQGRNWGLWGPYIFSDSLNRHVSDYLNNAPVTGFGSEAEVSIVATLYMALNNL